MYFLPRPEPGQRLLDIGCGNGVFLMHAASAGWQVAGADPDPKAVELVHRAGVEVRPGGIEAFDDSKETFDVITMSHIIEHVHDPKGVLQRAHALLKPGGILYIDTPNVDAHGHRRFREHWRGLEIPRHLVLFNWESLIQLLRDNGFSEVRPINRPTPYRFTAGQSRALQKNLDPYRYGKPTLIDKLHSFRAQIPGISKKRNTEFITLHAMKSHG